MSPDLVGPVTPKWRVRRSCLVGATFVAAVVAVAMAAPSHADDDYESDQSFSRGLDYAGVLFNFNLEKRQGQRYCRAVVDGSDTLDATYDLMRDGAYSFDVANGISSAAMVAYCTCSVMARQGLDADPILCRPYELAYLRENAN
ncbi:hypothetical protein GCM10023114_58200 [Mycolicibacterium sediminis]|uniref:DUF732 domain-containing protein n=1 Tax=Mycolicibacterium sediminis TaxID=1286180 RepID=A0A7I7QP20_9MYCO|nr:hypothetical protein MSEDJ_22340 [Mycolicibacterium sediminis]